jgi:hypothetical protein
MGLCMDSNCGGGIGGNLYYKECRVFMGNAYTCSYRLEKWKREGGIMALELTNVTREIYDSTVRLKNGSKEIFKLAKAKAEKERDYRRALAIEIVKLKTGGMQATLIPDVARGNTADLKFERDLAEAEYVAARDSLEAIQSQMNGLQSILKVQFEM